MTELPTFKPSAHLTQAGKRLEAALQRASDEAERLRRAKQSAEDALIIARKRAAQREQDAEVIRREARDLKASAQR